MSAKDDEPQQHGWMASMDEAHATCRQALRQASVDVSDPMKALWPAVPRRRMTQEHETVAICHAAVLDYAEHVEPYKNRVADLWTADIRRPHEFPDGEKFEVALSEIEEWSDARYEVTTTKRHELTGTTEEKKYYRIHLPPKYARDCFRKLNDCRERLKLVADPPTPERTVDEPEDAW